MAGENNHARGVHCRAPGNESNKYFGVRLIDHTFLPRFFYTLKEERRQDGCRPACHFLRVANLFISFRSSFVSFHKVCMLMVL